MSISPCSGSAYSINLQGRELVNHGTPLFPVAFYHDDLERDRVPWHWHDELEAVFVSSGETTVCAGARRYVLDAGQGFFVNADVLHSATGTRGTNCRYHSLVFHPRLIGDIDSVFWQKYLRVLIGSGMKSVALDGGQPWHAEALAQIEAAWQEGALDAPGYEFRVRALLSQLVFLLTCHLPEDAGRVSEKALRDGERIKRMLAYVQLNYAEELAASDIAGSAAISQSECLRCFRDTIGISPMQYVKRYRVQKAAELLTSTDMPNGEIGAQCGFQDASYFVRAFREVKGVPPGAYRRERAEGIGSIRKPDIIQ